MTRRISVCMASYNGQAYIRQQIESILSQLGADDELVVVDDASTDGTAGVVSSHEDPRIRLIRQPVNVGYTRNFERALREARGKYIILSDQDDIWLPGRVEAAMDALRDSDYVLTNCKTTNENLEVIRESWFEDFAIQGGFVRQLFRSRYLGCCAAFRAEILPAILPFPPRPDLVEHDTWIASVAELYFRVRLVDEPLILYRRHSSNTSLGGVDRGYPLWNKIYRRVYRLCFLAGRQAAAKQSRTQMRD